MNISSIFAKKHFFALFLVLFSGASFAHHSFAPYDIRSPIEIKGTVESFRYIQPHARLILIDENDVSWNIEVPNRRWERADLERDAIESGDQLTVRVFPARNGDPVAAISGFTKNGSYHNVMEEVMQRSANEAAEAIESGEAVEDVLDRYGLPEE